MRVSMRKFFATIISLTLLLGVLSSCSSHKEVTQTSEITSPDQLRVPRICDYRDEYVQLGYSTDGVYKSVSFSDSFIACSREYYSDEDELALLDFDYFGSSHLPVDSNGEPCVSDKELIIYDYDGGVLACVDLVETLGNIFYPPVITIDSSELIHVVAEVRELNIDEYQYYEIVVNSCGEIISTTALDLGGNYHVWDIACSSDGVMAIKCEDDNFMGHLLCVDSEGTLVSQEDSLANGCYDVLSVDGQVYCAVRRLIDDNESTLLIPLESFILGNDTTDYILPVGLTSLCPYTNGVLYYDELDESICFYNFADGSVVTLMSSSSYNGIFGFSDFYLDSFDNLISIGTNGIDSVYYLCKYIPLEEGYVDDREVLVIGGVGISDNPIISNMVFRFNMSHEDYRLETFDYGYMSDEELLTEFFFQTGSGEAPDILVDFPYDSISGEGYLYNLSPYLEALVNTGSYNSLLINSEGEHYYVPASYSVMGLLTDAVSDLRMETFEQFFALDSAHAGRDYAAVLANVSCEDLLTEMLQINMSSFFDVDSHSVSFDSDEFRDLLRFVNYVGNTTVYMETGDFSSSLLTNNYTMFDFYEFSEIANLLNLENYEFQRDVNFVGLPSNDGARYGFVPHYNFAISSNCEVPDVAWEFISGALEYDIQKVLAGVEFAVNNEANRDRFSEISHQMYLSGGQSFDVDGAYSDFENVINGSDGVVVVDDPQLMAICMEAAASYFSGAKDEFEVSRIIQNQAQTVMDERY